MKNVAFTWTQQRLSTKKEKLVSDLSGHWGIHIFTKSAHDKPLLLSFVCNHQQYFSQQITTIIIKYNLLKRMTPHFGNVISSLK